MLVDEDGWDELLAELAGTLERFFDIQAASAERLTKADAPGIPVTVAAMCFEAKLSDQRKVAPAKKKKKG